MDVGDSHTQCTCDRRSRAGVDALIPMTVALVHHPGVDPGHDGVADAGHLGESGLRQVTLDTQLAYGFLHRVFCNIQGIFPFGLV